MDQVRYTSLQIMLWEDKMFKMMRNRSILHHDHISLQIQNPHGAEDKGSIDSFFDNSEPVNHPKKDEESIN